MNQFSSGNLVKRFVSDINAKDFASFMKPIESFVQATYLASMSALFPVCFDKDRFV